MADIIGILTNAFAVLPAHRWHGTSKSGNTIEVTGHAVGLDVQRGPWVKFDFTETEAGGTKVDKEIQGYPVYRGGVRVKMGPGKEFDNDKMGVQVKVEDFAVHTIVTFGGTLAGVDLEYTFDGKNS